MYKSKRITALLAGSVIAAVPFVSQITVVSAEDYVIENPEVLTLFGDVNFDGSVGIADAVQLNRYLLGQTDELGNWMNADVYEDGAIDAFDMVYLRKHILGEKTTGGKVNIKVVDMMTGEELETADVLFTEEKDSCLYNIGEWTITPDDELNIYGLPNDPSYTYLLWVSNLPEGYGDNFGVWDHTFEFSFDENSDTKDVVIRVLADDEECNIDLDYMDWTQGEEYIGYGNVSISDKDGNSYYQKLYVDKVALPDGEYNAKYNLFDYPVQLVDPDSDFAKEIKELYPDIDIEDISDGIDFTVKDGKADKDIRFNFGPMDGCSNYVTVNCIDSMTGEQIKGAEIAIVEAPKKYARTVKSWTSDGESKIISGLYHTGPYAYEVKVVSAPEGYTCTGSTYLNWGYVYNYSNDVNFYFIPDTAEKGLTLNVYKWPDNELYNDYATYSIWTNDEKILGEVRPGEEFALPDGDYYTVPNAVSSEDEKYEGIELDSALGLEFAGAVNCDDYIGRSDVFHFTVKDGKTTQPIKLYVGEKPQEEGEEETEVKE